MHVAFAHGALGSVASTPCCRLIPPPIGIGSSGDWVRCINQGTTAIPFFRQSNLKSGCGFSTLVRVLPLFFECRSVSIDVAQTEANFMGGKNKDHKARCWNTISRRGPRSVSRRRGGAFRLL